MLSTIEILDELEHLSYKPGWTFHIYDGVWEGQHFVIRTEVLDASIAATTTLDIHSMLPPCADLQAFHRWLAWRLQRIETHEMREFLRRDGTPLFDPHAPGAEHDA